MISTNEQIITTLETRLKEAMCKSNVQELDELLHDELIFTNHLGHIMTKHDDLNAHKSGILKIDDIEIKEQNIKLYNRFSLVTTLVRIKGSFNGDYSESDFRFSRVWSQNQGGYWQIVMAHSSLVI